MLFLLHNKDLLGQFLSTLYLLSYSESLNDENSSFFQ